MVTGQLTFGDLPPRDTGRNFDVPRCIASTVFTSDLLVATARDDVLLTENNLSAVINVAYAIALCRSLIGKRRQVSVLSVNYETIKYYKYFLEYTRST